MQGNASVVVIFFGKTGSTCNGKCAQRAIKRVTEVQSCSNYNLRLFSKCETATEGDNVFTVPKLIILELMRKPQSLGNGLKERI